MAKRAYGLDWLEEKNMTQRAWACDYLNQKEMLPASTNTATPITHQDLLSTGYALEKTAEGVRTLQAMRSAWRQREYRQLKHDRKPYTFTLPIQTKHQLSQQAEKCQHSEAEHLIKLIELGYEETIAQSKYMQEARAKERKDLPKARAEVVFWQLRGEELTRCLKESLQARFTAEGVPEEELQREVERTMDLIEREVRARMHEHESTNPRLKHLGQ